MAADSPLPISKISIPGPTLSSLLNHSSTTSGLLFGHLSSLPSPSPSDSDPSPSPSLSLSLTVTSFLSSSPPFPFFSPLGLPDPTSPLLRNPNPNVVGWFSSRPSSPLRPSMRDLAVSNHLSTKSPSKFTLFLLFSSSSSPNHAVHTHRYRAFLLVNSALTPVSIDVINVGPKFRGQYGSFLPEASLGFFPMMPCGVRGEEEGGSGNGEEGFGKERLEGLVGRRAGEYVKDVEDLYGKMMEKLEGLVRLVEDSSAKVQEQEARNSVLQSRIASSD